MPFWPLSEAGVRWHFDEVSEHYVGLSIQIVGDAITFFRRQNR